MSSIRVSDIPDLLEMELSHQIRVGNVAEAQALVPRLIDATQRENAEQQRLTDEYRYLINFLMKAIVQGGEGVFGKATADNVFTFTRNAKKYEVTIQLRGTA